MTDKRAAIRKMLADAISLGTQLAEFDYAHPIESPEAAGVLKSLEQLRVSTRNFLDSASLESLSDQDVFPIYPEIMHNLTVRSAACTQEKK